MRHYAQTFSSVVIDPGFKVEVQIEADVDLLPQIFSYGTDWPRDTTPPPWFERRFPRLFRLWWRIVYLTTRKLPKKHPPDPVVVEQLLIGKMEMFHCPIAAYLLAAIGEHLDLPLARKGTYIRLVLSTDLCACKRCDANGNRQRSVSVRFGVGGTDVSHERLRVVQ